MIYFPQSRYSLATELPVAASVTIAAEGVALMGDNTGGVFGARPSAGAGTDQFLGLAVSQQITTTSAARAESFVQPVGNTITLALTPTGGTISVWDVTAGGVVPVGGGGWSISGRVITLQAGTVGHELIAYYKYSPTAAQARTLQGDQYPGGPAGALVQQVGVVRNGLIYTDQFDSTVNWNAAALTVKTGASGQLTIGGSGVAIPCAVVHVPQPGMPYLGLLLTA